MNQHRNIHPDRISHYDFRKQMGALVEEFQLSWEFIFSQSAVGFSKLRDANSLVTAQELIALSHSVFAQIEDYNLLAEFALRNARMRNQSPAIAFAASKNVGDGLVRVQAVKPVESPFQLNINIGESGWRVGFSLKDDVAKMPPLLDAILLIWLLEVIRSTTGDRVENAHLVGDMSNIQAEIFAERCRLSIQTGAPQFLFIPNEALDIELPKIPSVLQNEPRKSEATEVGLASELRRELAHCLASGQFSIDHLAEQLHMSRRSLQRRLADEGVTYSDLLLETRMKLADQYLQASDMNIKEIAFLLGYSEPSALYRAYRKFNGVSFHFPKTSMRTGTDSTSSRA